MFKDINKLRNIGCFLKLTKHEKYAFYKFVSKFVIVQNEFLVLWSYINQVYLNKN